jgi:hypothetical protein
MIFLATSARTERDDGLLLEADSATASKVPAVVDRDTANGYVSENDTFSFCLARILLRKTVQCCLENLCVRAIEGQDAANSHPERLQAKHEKLYESEKRTELIQSTISPLVSQASF